MQLKLNRYDIIMSIFVIIVAVFLLFFVLSNNNKDSKKTANLYYENKLVKTFDLSQKKDETYEIEATNGLVKVETKNGKIRVVNETSKNNICSIQGWSDSTLNPIVCLPNSLYIKIVNKNADEEVDVFIK